MAAANGSTQASAGAVAGDGVAVGDAGPLLSALADQAARSAQLLAAGQFTQVIDGRKFRAKVKPEGQAKLRQVLVPGAEASAAAAGPQHGPASASCKKPLPANATAGAGEGEAGSPAKRPRHDAASAAAEGANAAELLQTLGWQATRPFRALFEQASSSV